MKSLLLAMALFAARRAPAPPKKIEAKAVPCPGLDEPEKMMACVLRASKAGREALITGTCQSDGRVVHALIRIVDGGVVITLLERCD